MLAVERAMGNAGEARRRRVAANDRLAAGGERRAAVEIACECGRPGCGERLSLTRRQFEELRRHRRCAVVRGHEGAGDEVVAYADTFLVVSGSGPGSR